MEWHLIDDYYPPENKRVLFYNSNRDKLHVGSYGKPMILMRFIGFRKRVYWDDGGVDPFDNLLQGGWFWTEVDFDLPGRVIKRD